MKMKRQARGGSALVIVLGFLAILLIMVFAFAVKMQTEYRIARTADSNVRTEFVMVQGIHLTALEVGHPVQLPNQSYWYYPRKEVVSSAGVLVGSLLSGCGLITNFLASPADRFIPLAVFNTAIAEGSTNYLGILPSQFGAYVPDPFDTTAPGDGYTQAVVATDFEPSGVAYCLFNNSGYLDVNTPYNTAARGYGRDAKEIRLNGVVSPTAIGSLPSGRNLHPRIESMMELYAYRNSFGLAADSDLSMFNPYSHSVLGQFLFTNNAPRDAFMIGTVSNVQSRSADVLNAFEWAGFVSNITVSASNIPAYVARGWLLTNLLDYIDSDTLPRCDWLIVPSRPQEQPCQEMVPGVNELAVTATYSCTLINTAPTNYSYSLNLVFDVELWRPHLSTVSEDCYVRFGAGSLRIPACPLPFTGSLRNNLNVDARAIVNSRTPTNMTSLTTGLRITLTTNCNSATFYPNLSYQVGMGSDITLRRGSPTSLDILDKVWNLTRFTLTNSIVQPLVVGNIVSNTTTVSMEAIDPRCNGLYSNSVYWVVGTNTIGATNTATLAYLTNPGETTDYQPGDDIDKATYAFSRDDTNLFTIGELGYLVVAPWRTVRLCKGPGVNQQRVESVVDTFTLDKPGATANGLVNPNTCFTGVLQAVFNEMPMDLYATATPGPGATNLSSAQAATTARSILEYTYLATNSAFAASSTGGLRRGLLNLSELGNVSTIFLNPSVLTTNLGADCEFRREAIIRNSVGLLSTRNMRYDAVLCASDEIDGGGWNLFPIRISSRMGAEHKAVAMVWRDPWTKETFIRHFRYLPNDGVLDLY